GSVAWATPTAKLNFLGAADYAMLYNEAVKNENPNASLPYSDEGSVAWATPTAKLNFLGAADYAMLYNEAVKNENP
ncbi:hypothetical protein E7X19_26735, partial [Bacteroides fragilis]